MNLKNKSTAKSIKPRKGLHDGSHGAIREQLLSLEPVRLRDIGVVASIKLRPAVSNMAKKEGLNYVSVSLGKGECVFIAVETEE